MEKEIPLEEFKKRAAPIIAALYELDCPTQLDCEECLAYFHTSIEKQYVGCMICRLQERFNPEEAP